VKKYLVRGAGLLEDVVVVGVVQVAPDADELRRQLVVLEAGAGDAQVVKLRKDLAVQVAQLKVAENKFLAGNLKFEIWERFKILGQAAAVLLLLGDNFYNIL
jgi:hypothetical protein